MIPWPWKGLFNEWLMEYNTSQWEILRANRAPQRRNLLEARFHIANAEVFMEAMSESDRSIKEL